MYFTRCYLTYLIFNYVHFVQSVYVYCIVYLNVVQSIVVLHRYCNNKTYLLTRLLTYWRTVYSRVGLLYKMLSNANQNRPDLNCLHVQGSIRRGGCGGSTPAGKTATPAGEHLKNVAGITFWPAQLTTAIRELRPDEYFNFTLLFGYSVLVSLPAITIFAIRGPTYF